MLTIIFATLAVLGVSVLLRVSHLVHSNWGVLFPSLIAFLAVVVIALRRTQRMIDPLVKEAEKHIMGGRVEMGIKTLEDGMRLGRWHPFIPAQLRSMIGSLYFDMGKMDQAEPLLAGAMRWPWNTKALLGSIYFKRRDEPRMVKAFETAVSVGAKEPLAWTIYAYCMQSRGNKDATVKILERALKKLPGDARLEGNLELAKEGKKLKVAPYGDKWSRFRIDSDGPPLPKAARGFAVRPGFRQRPRRGK